MTAKYKLDALKDANNLDINIKKMPLEDRKEMPDCCKFHPENISKKLAGLEAAWEEKKKKEEEKKKKGKKKK